jgi:hypothetical protein
MFNLQELDQIITEIDQTHRLIESNVNPKIALEVMFEGIRKLRSRSLTELPETKCQGLTHTN